jgi:hypothetical protein
VAVEWRSSGGRVAVVVVVAVKWRWQSSGGGGQVAIVVEWRWQLSAGMVQAWVDQKHLKRDILRLFLMSKGTIYLR